MLLHRSRAHEFDQKWTRSKGIWYRGMGVGGAGLGKQPHITVLLFGLLLTFGSTPWSLWVSSLSPSNLASWKYIYRDHSTFCCPCRCYHSASGFSKPQTQHLNPEPPGPIPGPEGPALSTCVDASPEPELLLGHLPDLEVDSGTEEVQGHRGSLVHVLDSIADGKSTSHHVRISNGFHLKIKQQSGLALRPPALKSRAPWPPLPPCPSISTGFCPRSVSPTEPSFPEPSCTQLLLSPLNSDSGGDHISSTQVQNQLNRQQCTNGVHLEGSHASIEWNSSYPIWKVFTPCKGS